MTLFKYNQHQISLVWSWLVWFITFFLPDTLFTMKLRGYLYGLFMLKCGRNFQVGSNVIIRGLENISVGNDIYIAPKCVFLIGKSLLIEDQVMIAFNTLVTDGNHTKIRETKSYRFGYREQKPVLIKFGSWIGGNSVILPGAIIGKGSVVGAGTVVRGIIPDESLIVGNPMRIIKRI